MGVGVFRCVWVWVWGIVCMIDAAPCAPTPNIVTAVCNAIQNSARSEENSITHSMCVVLWLRWAYVRVSLCAVCQCVALCPC